MSAAVATVSLLLTVASLLAFPFGAVFAPFTFGLFLLALAGIFSGLEDRTVHQRKPVLDGERWRNGYGTESANANRSGERFVGSVSDDATNGRADRPRRASGRRPRRAADALPKTGHG